MRLLTTIVLLLVISIAAQGQRTGIVLDESTKNPIEFVDIYNSFDHTITNADGGFFILTDSDSIQFRKIGFQELKLSVDEVKDTIFLTQKVLELEGVTLTNMKSLWDKVRDSASANYMLKPFKERFFLRCLLRKNGKIIRLQDIAGKLSRQTLLYKKGMNSDKNDFQFEIEQMRQIGLKKDENGALINFSSLSSVLYESIRLNATGEGFVVNEKRFENEPYSKIYVKSDGNQSQFETTGEYIINNQNNALESVLLRSEIDAAFQKNGAVERRPLNRYQTANFNRTKDTKKYFMTSAKLNWSWQLKGIKEDFDTIYGFEYILYTFDNNGDFTFKANANNKKDIFKLKYKYNSTFWDNQKTLPLTHEMIEFIESLASKDEEFKVRRNFN